MTKKRMCLNVEAAQVDASCAVDQWSGGWMTKRLFQVDDIDQHSHEQYTMSMAAIKEEQRLVLNKAKSKVMVLTVSSSHFDFRARLR